MAVAGTPRRHRVLVLRALGLGDLLTAVPALRGIRRELPDSEITLAAPAWLAPLIGLIGAVDALVDTPDLGAVRPHGASPDLVVNLHGSGPQSIAAALRLLPSQIITHAHPAFPELGGPEWKPELHEIDRWCRLVRWAGFPVDRYELGLAAPPTDLSALAPVIASSNADDSGVAVVHPGASAGARRWPVERFAAVAAELAERGFTVLITGSVAEQRLAEQVAISAGCVEVCSVAGRLALDELAALVAAARLVVCGDTGIAHLASAYRTPSVVLFGPTPPALWGPPTCGPHVALWRGAPGDPHADRADPGLLAIEVDEVLRAADAVVPVMSGR